MDMVRSHVSIPERGGLCGGVLPMSQMCVRMPWPQGSGGEVQPDVRVGAKTQKLF